MVVFKLRIRGSKRHIVIWRQFFRESDRFKTSWGVKLIPMIKTSGHQDTLQFFLNGEPSL